MIEYGAFCIHRGFRNGRNSGESIWAMTGSNCRHPACKAGALPAELIALYHSVILSCYRVEAFCHSAFFSICVFRMDQICFCSFVQKRGVLRKKSCRRFLVFFFDGFQNFFSLSSEPGSILRISRISTFRSPNILF